MNNRFEILPGVFLTAVQSQKFKTGCISINFLRRMCHEEASKNALIPSVLLRGSEKYPDIRSISARLDEMFGASMGTLIRKKGDVQMIGFFADFIEEQFAKEPILAPMLDFASEILLHPRLENGAFLQDVVESEKLNLQNAVESRINDKRTYAVSEMLKTMCADEAFGIPRLGEAEDLQQVNAENLYAQYLEVLKNSQVELFYLGRECPEKVAELFRNVLSELPRGTYQKTQTEVRRTAGEVKNVRKKMDVTQGKLSLGFRTGITITDADYPALLMCNAIFGAGITSKLFLKVREEMSLCYYASSSLERYKGIMIVSSGIEFDKFDVTYREILHQLEECKSGNISDYEFDSAKRFIRSELLTSMDSPGRLDDFYMGQVVSGMDFTMQELSERIAEVTKQQVSEAAKKLTLDTVFFLEGGEQK